MVVDKLINSFQADSTIGIAYFYCSWQQEDQGTERLLGSIVQQLGGRLQPMPSSLLDLYQHHSTKATHPSVAELFDALKTVVASMSKVYLVIDAWDELSSTSRRALLPRLLTMQSTSRVNILVTSRPLPDIVSRFENYPSLDFSQGNIDQDLGRYIDHFMPKTPDDTYEEAMQKIEGLPEEERNLAKKALAWLTFAERPLKGVELRHALAIEDGSSGLNKGKIPDNEEIVALCKVFVRYWPKSDIWRLKHSAHDYLRKTLDTWGPDAKGTVATGCLSYLAFKVFEEGCCKNDEDFDLRLRQFPLYEYAARYWGHHFSEASLLPGNEIRSFLMNEARVASASQAMVVIKDTPPSKGYSQRFIKQQTGLHIVAQFGLMPLIKTLLAEGQNPTAKDSDGRTPLWYATANSHKDVMRSLSSVDRTTFTLMLAERKEDLASLLIQSGGSIIKDTRRRTALHLGVLHDNLHIMQEACRYGVDINSKDGDGNSPIQLAIQKTKSRAIDWLLENSAETANITHEEWLRAYATPKSSIVVLSGETQGPKKVNFLTRAEFETNITFHPPKWKRLL